MAVQGSHVRGGRLRVRLRRKQSRAPLLKALFGRADVVWFKALEQSRSALAFKSARHVAWFLGVASFSAGPAMR